MHTILREYAPACESCSIDEVFLRRPQRADGTALGHRMREHVLQWCGIPCRVGYGPTKTLAKLANRLAKRGNGDGVVDLGDPATHDAALAATPVEDVRGIGARWAARLNDLGIATALALRDAPALQIRQHFGVVVERTQRELQGHSCLAIEDVAPSRKQVVSSRTFGTPVTDESTMVAAVAHHVTRACERVRAQGLAAAMQVFFHTSPFRQGPQCAVAGTVGFAVPCSDTRVMLTAARQLVAARWRSGVPFAKAGVCLLDLVAPAHAQEDLFSRVPSDADTPLMAAVDRINRKFGRNTLRFGTQALAPEANWQMRQAALSPRYTTRWEDVTRTDCRKGAA